MNATGFAPNFPAARAALSLCCSLCRHKPAFDTDRALASRDEKNAPRIWAEILGPGEVRVYRGTGVSRGVRQTTWDRSLKNWELQIPCFEEFFWGGNTLGFVPASLPHTLGFACTFYAPTSPPLKFRRPTQFRELLRE